MNSFNVIRYTSNYKELWNEFVRNSKNATFLFHRDFMEYHSDRFEDYSLIIFYKNNIVALLPANKEGDLICSHRGLTYGGILFQKKIKAYQTEQIIDIIIEYLKNNNIVEFRIKLIPSFYNNLMTDDLDYFLFKKGGVLFKKSMNLAINLKSDFQISKSKLKHFKKIVKTDITYKHDSQLDDFWNLILIPRLFKKHNTHPIHNLNEIKELAKKFPENIKQYSVYENNTIIAGITIFETTDCVKSQYGATSDRGEELRALDFLFINLIKKYKDEGKLYFDMGIVDSGESYNLGLLNQKQELGCSVYNQDYYVLKII